MERARILGTRALQIRHVSISSVSCSVKILSVKLFFCCASMNAPVMVELEGETDPLEVNLQFQFSYTALQLNWSGKLTGLLQLFPLFVRCQPQELTSVVRLNQFTRNICFLKWSSVCIFSMQHNNMQLPNLPYLQRRKA